MKQHLLVNNVILLAKSIFCCERNLIWNWVCIAYGFAVLCFEKGNGQSTNRVGFLRALSTPETSTKVQQGCFFRLTACCQCIYLLSIFVLICA